MEKKDCLSIPWSMFFEDGIFGHVYKVLVLDLESDSFAVLKNEDSDNPGSNTLLSEWFTDFLNENKIHPEDRYAYESFTSIEKIKKHFESSDCYIYTRYRRKNESGWTWATMDLFLYPQFPLDRNKLLLVVRDIDSDYSRELSHQRDVEYSCNTDSLTGLGNRFAYINKCRDFCETNQKVGVIYCDLNGLKFSNDNFGHEKGDELIKKMAEIMVSSFRQNECFRIGGDEFVVFLADIERGNFESRAKAFMEFIEGRSDGFLLACSGYSWCPGGSQLEAHVKAAEKMMYANKEKFRMTDAGRIYSRQ